MFNYLSVALDIRPEGKYLQIYRDRRFDIFHG